MSSRRSLTILMMSLLALLALSQSAMGATYYVDDNGDDANNGLTAGTPWKTISHAATTVPAGTSGTPNVIMVLAGTYDETNNGEAFPVTFANDHVTLIGAGSAITFIDVDQSGLAALQLEAKGFSVSGFTFRNTGNAITVSKGGFTVADNIFEDSVAVGIIFVAQVAGLTASVSFADMAITGNTFMTTSAGVLVNIEQFFDDTVEGLSAAFGNFTVNNNRFPVTSGNCISIENLFTTGGLDNGTVSVGHFSVINNRFTGGDSGLIFWSRIRGIVDTRGAVGNTVITGNTFSDQQADALSIRPWSVTGVAGSSSIVQGAFTIADNVISSDNSRSSIRIIYETGIDIFDESNVTSGPVNIRNNTVYVPGVGLEFILVAGQSLGQQYQDDPVLLRLGPINVTGNSFTSERDYGVVFRSDIGRSTYGRSQMVMEPFTFSGNTVTAYRAIRFDNRWGQGMHEDSSLQIKPLTISDNTINSFDRSLSLRITGGNDMHDNASLTVNECNIRNNLVSASMGTALEVFIYGNGSEMFDNASLSMQPFTVANNIISAADRYGSLFDLSSNATSIHSYATVSLPDLIITGNIIDVAGDPRRSPGILMQSHSTATSLYDYAQVYTGSLLIDGNTFNPDRNYGMGIGVELRFSDYWENVSNASKATFGDMTLTNNTMYNLGEYGIIARFTGSVSRYSDRPVLTWGDLDISRNTIDTAEYGIWLNFDTYAAANGIVTYGDHTFRDNNLTNIADTGIRYELWNQNANPTTASLAMGTPTFSGNTIDGWPGFEDGINVTLDNATDGITIGSPSLTGNSVSGFDYGMHFVMNNQDTATIRCNTLNNNDVSGLRFSTDASGLTATYNSFVDNADWGLSVDDGNSAAVNAADNWWGDKLGPAACSSCNGVNAGDMGTVNFTPWLPAPPSSSQCGGFPWVMFRAAINGRGSQ